MSAIWICGVDEAGRGPLVGSVVAGAVILDPDQPIMGLKDSKKLSPARRENLYAEIILKAKAWGIGEASAQEIDQINILQATMLAMQRAVEDLVKKFGQWPHKALIDGNRCPKLPIASDKYSLVASPFPSELILSSPRLIIFFASFLLQISTM